MVVGGLAFAVNNLCILLFLSGGLIFFWPLGWVAALLLYPAMHISALIDPYIGSIVSSDIIAYLFSFIQFYIVFWIILRVVLLLKKRQPPAI
jgi:hypothetical protein